MTVFLSSGPGTHCAPTHPSTHLAGLPCDVEDGRLPLRHARNVVLEADPLIIRLVGLESQELHQLALVGVVLHHAELDALAELLPELDVRVLFESAETRGRRRTTNNAQDEHTHENQESKSTRKQGLSCRYVTLVIILSRGSCLSEGTPSPVHDILRQSLMCSTI